MISFVIVAVCHKYKMSSKLCWNIGIWRFSRWRSSANLNFYTVTSMPFDRDYCRISHQFTKIFRKSDNTLLSYGQKWRFTIWCPSAILNLKVLSFDHRISVIVIIYSSVKISLKNLAIFYSFPRWRSLLLELASCTKFRENRTICCQAIAKNDVFNMASVRHFEF